MKVIFLGVGEAFDENTPNNSHLIVTEKTKLLLDCGLTAAPQVWKFNPGQSFLDAIYISHWHADHYFGLPGLLVRMWEGGNGRTRPITIISRKGFKDQFKKLMDLAYLGFQEKFNFNIEIIEINEKEEIAFNDLKLSFNPTVHSGENLAVKISDGKNAVAYSGDGSPIAGNNFYKSLDLLILETYLYDKEIIGHSSIVSAISFAENNNVKCLALTHINRDFRKNELPKLKDKIKTCEKVKIIIPEPLDEYDL
ncbi:MAG: ribonuclease Z [Candidatus Staskawiczbacteria bacterium]|jgi:ribonuclease BN (tRNA processing enzyme)